MVGASRRAGPVIITIVMMIIVGTAIFLAIRKPAVSVDLGIVTRGPMAVTIDDEGEAIVHDVFVVSAPLNGRLLRIDLEPGDPVKRNSTVVARILPAEPAFLDVRSRASAEAQERMYASQLASSRARVNQALAERALADRDLQRVQDLNKRGFSTQAALDAARMRHDRAEAALAEARSAVAAAGHQLNAARAALISPSAVADGGGAGVVVTAPVSGTVLRIRQKSEALVTSGMPLIEIGDPEQMEIVTDLLSTEAVKVAVGAAVEIDKWGGSQPLHGKVRRVDPSGFTKVSSLGVEEQRVNVYIDITDPHSVWQKMGHGYRVIVRIASWSNADVLRVPVSALFRQQNGWATFVVQKGRAHLVPIEIDHLNDEVAEVRKGLSQGDRVILHPGDTIKEGRKVVERQLS